jgi:hypothetical protein
MCNLDRAVNKAFHTVKSKAKGSSNKYMKNRLGGALPIRLHLHVRPKGI